MPRRRTQSTRRAIALGALAVALGIAGLVGLSVLASQGTVEVQLGDEEFTGDAERLAAEIDDRGPFLLPDASARRERDVYLQHLGDDPGEGWLAFDARAPGQDDRACALRWDGERFVDPCTGESFPADGEGLTQYPTRVEDGTLHVRFRPGSGS